MARLVDQISLKSRQNQVHSSTISILTIAAIWTGLMLIIRRSNKRTQWVRIFLTVYTYKKLLGRSKAALCISPGWSKLSHISLDIVVFLISASCCSVKRAAGLSFSYLKNNNTNEIVTIMYQLGWRKRFHLHIMWSTLLIFDLRKGIILNWFVDIFIQFIGNCNKMFTYQNLSHFLSCLNWMAMIQAKVGPTRPPCSGLSLIPPGNRSMSSTVA